jgi:hypothetical protein
MMRKDLIIIPILLVGVVAGSVVGMGYSPAESPDKNQIINITKITKNLSIPAKVQNNSTQKTSTTQKSTATTNTQKTTSTSTYNTQKTTTTQKSQTGTTNTSSTG